MTTSWRLLPDADGRRVLDLGCGAGQLAHHLATAGAAEVVGVDVSERMLALARAGWAHPRVTYRREAIEEVAFPPARFDLVVSSLAFHYVDDYAGLIRRIAGWLAPGGVLVYSTEHPIFTARLPDGGWVLDERGAAHRLEPGPLRRRRRTRGNLVRRGRAEGPPHAGHADQRPAGCRARGRARRSSRSPARSGSRPIRWRAMSDAGPSSCWSAPANPLVES